MRPCCLVWHRRTAWIEVQRWVLLRDMDTAVVCCFSDLPTNELVL